MTAKTCTSLAHCLQCAISGPSLIKPLQGIIQADGFPQGEWHHNKKEVRLKLSHVGRAAAKSQMAKGSAGFCKS